MRKQEACLCELKIVNGNEESNRRPGLELWLMKLLFAEEHEEPSTKQSQSAHRLVFLFFEIVGDLPNQKLEKQPNPKPRNPNTAHPRPNIRRNIARTNLIRCRCTRHNRRNGTQYLRPQQHKTDMQPG